MVRDGLAVDAVVADIGMAPRCGRGARRARDTTHADDMRFFVVVDRPAPVWHLARFSSCPDGAAGKQSSILSALKRNDHY